MKFNPVKINGKVPLLKDCIAYLKDKGWQLQHRCLDGRYFFRNEENHTKEVSFTLRELREAYLYGW